MNIGPRLPSFLLIMVLLLDGEVGSHPARPVIISWLFMMLRLVDAEMFKSLLSCWHCVGTLLGALWCFCLVHVAVRGYTTGFFPLKPAATGRGFFPGWLWARKLIWWPRASTLRWGTAGRLGSAHTTAAACCSVLHAAGFSACMLCLWVLTCHRWVASFSLLPVHCTSSLFSVFTVSFSCFIPCNVLWPLYLRCLPTFE